VSPLRRPGGGPGRAARGGAGGAPRSAPRPARDPRTFRGPAWISAALTLAVLAVVAVPLARGWRPWRVAAPPPVPPVPASPADTLDARAAYLEGARLYTERRALEALPYFRRVGALLADPPRDYHLQMVDVLERASLQPRRDAAQSATRGSAERVALVREALAHLDAAERRSRTPRELADVRVWRANLLRVWGFPWEALLALRSAAAADPAWRDVAAAGDLYAHRVHHPHVRVPGVDDNVILRDAP
jgi:hypothetical protein